MMSVCEDLATKLFVSNVEEEVTTIDKLSDEVLLKIFSFLDVEFLWDACLVCKSWDSLIGSSTVTMSKTKLKLDPERIEERKQYETDYHRKYVNVSIFYSNVFEKISEFSDRFDFSLTKNLQIYGPQSIEIHDMMKFLSKFPLIQNLDLHPLFVTHKTTDKTEIVSFPRLRRLEIDSVNCSALKFFEAKLLSDLFVNGYRVPIEDDQKSLKKFLERSENLKTLEVNAHIFTGIFGNEIETKFNFHLKFFEMSYQCKMETPTAKSFNAFLHSQSSTLVTLKLNSLKNIPSSVFLIIINKLQKLETFCINVSSMPSSQAFLGKLKPNNSVKNLRVYGSFPSDESAEGFFGSFPSVEKIDVRDYIGSQLNYIARYNTKVNELKLFSLSSPVLPESVYSNLKTLTISSIKDSNAWMMSLVGNSPLLENLSIEWVDKGNILRPEIEFLLQHTSLRSLKLEGNYDDAKIIFDTLKINYGHLKYLGMKMYETSECGTTVVANAEFEFPEDRDQWNIEEADAKFDKAWDDRSW